MDISEDLVVVFGGEGVGKAPRGIAESPENVDAKVEFMTVTVVDAEDSCIVDDPGIGETGILGTGAISKSVSIHVSSSLFFFTAGG